MKTLSLLTLLLTISFSAAAESSVAANGETVSTQCQQAISSLKQALSEKKDLVKAGQLVDKMCK